MDIMLRLQDLNQIPGELFKGREALTEIFTYLDEAELLAPFSVYSKDYSSRHKKIKSGADLIEESQSWDEGSYDLYIDSKESEEYLAKAILAKSYLWFLMSVSENSLDKLNPGILQNWIGLVSELSRKYTNDFYFGSYLAVEVHSFWYPQERPVRAHPLVRSEDLINFFSKKFHQEHPKGNWTELERIITAKLPDFARLEEHDDLVILRWVDDDDLADEEVLRHKLAEKEKFLAEVLNAPLAEGWNEAGDEEFSTIMLTPHPPLTFYDAAMEIGYKAVYTGSAGEVDEEQFSEFSDWLEQGELPDGTPLKGMGIVVQGREQALGVRERAQAAGIEEVFYTDNEGRWWNPFLPDE